MTETKTQKITWPVEEMPHELQAMNEQARTIYFDLLRFSSEKRASEMYIRLRGVDTETFWRVFNECWNICDDTWLIRTWWSDVLRYHSRVAPARRFMVRSEDKALFDCLPARIEIFRGCNVNRVRGLSWTTKRKIAEGFAHGHRGIRVEEPVVATAIIPREAVFTAIDNREESELVVNPRRLAKLTYTPYIS
jgi:hypothetical protein